MKKAVKIIGIVLAVPVGPELYKKPPLHFCLIIEKLSLCEYNGKRKKPTIVFNYPV